MDLLRTIRIETKTRIEEESTGKPVKKTARKEKQTRKKAI